MSDDVKCWCGGKARREICVECLHNKEILAERSIVYSCWLRGIYAAIEDGANIEKVKVMLALTPHIGKFMGGKDCE